MPQGQSQGQPAQVPFVCPGQQDQVWQVLPVLLALQVLLVQLAHCRCQEPGLAEAYSLQAGQCPAWQKRLRKGQVRAGAQAGPGIALLRHFLPSGPEAAHTGCGQQPARHCISGEAAVRKVQAGPEAGPGRPRKQESCTMERPRRMAGQHPALPVPDHRPQPGQYLVIRFPYRCRRWQHLRPVYPCSDFLP